MCGRRRLETRKLDLRAVDGELVQKFESLYRERKCRRRNGPSMYDRLNGWGDRIEVKKRVGGLCNPEVRTRPVSAR